jgi:hypothetical protein
MKGVPVTGHPSSFKDLPVSIALVLRGIDCLAYCEDNAGPVVTSIN